jgi:hypothetical protein
MMRQAFNFLILAVGLAGCGTATQTPSDTRNDKEGPLPPGQGAFGNAFTWEWRKKDAPAPASAAPATAQPATPAPAGTTPQDANKERQEFEEWRAWQEWKRKNQK